MSRRATRAAKKLSAEHGRERFPVDVHGLARALDIRVVEKSMDDSISAMLYRYDDGTAVIGINAGHSALRARFSIAHELGHYLMHPGRPLIVDGVRVSFRNRESALATQPEEIEANAFAAELLMPESAVRRTAQHEADSEEALAKYLAAKFQVSEQAMSYRLTNLGIQPGI